MWVPVDFDPQLRGLLEKPTQHAHFLKLDTRGSPGWGDLRGSPQVFFYHEALANLKLWLKTHNFSHISVRKTSVICREAEPPIGPNLLSAPTLSLLLGWSYGSMPG